MSIKIYLLKTHKINLTNIVAAQLIENAGDSCYGPCLYSLDGKFINTVPGEFAKFQIQSTGKDGRYIHWASYMDSLNTSVDQAANENKFLIFGSHDAEQLSFLKSYYDKDIMTIAVNYYDSNYELLMQNLVEYHLHLLKTQVLAPSAHDNELLSTLSNYQLLSHYKSEFDTHSLIPHTSVTAADYTINVDDLFSPNHMSIHFNNIGLPFTDTSRVFYDSWLSAM